MVKAGIIGATGYAGNEIVRILLSHRDVEIRWFGSRSYIDQKYASVYQNLFQIVDDVCKDDNIDKLADEVDVIFTATPQGLCSSIINEEVLKKVGLSSGDVGENLKEACVRRISYRKGQLLL